MPRVELVIGLLAGIALLGGLAERAGLPYPPVLVVGGLVLAVIPGLPAVHLQPDMILFGFLPPLVYAAAYRAASFDLASQASHIITLATGLVLFTVALAAVVGHLVADLPWVAAFALGALCAPTDPVSASAIVREIGAPEQIVVILEGESLINDGTGLAAFQVTIAAAAGGFSVSQGIFKFVTIAVGGAAIGIAAGVLIAFVRRRLNQPSLEVAIGLLGAFGSYAAADAAGCSGVLAAVAAGLFVGRRAEDISSPEVRLRVEPFWDALSFLLESLLFLLIGLELPDVVKGLPGGNAWTGIADGAAIVATVIALRFLWMFGFGRCLPVAGRIMRVAIDPIPAKQLTVLGWSGMRGAVSLAGALSIPVLAGSQPFPARDQVIFLVYCAVIGTLIVPSFTLGPLVQKLGLGESAQLREQEIRARIRVNHAALARLEELAEQHQPSEEIVARLRGIYELRLTRLENRLHDDRPEDSEHVDGALPLRELRSEIVSAERRAVGQIRSERAAPAEVLGRIQHDIDLEEARLRRERQS
ncbi:MAG: Na+/H+ antiporter [Solirubrobacterales bacterium]|nr:Na+/H+ antiporter [Solirubrobacterales bacterium]